MPIGSYANLYYVAKELENKKPKTVLDLGIGFGMNGVLVRQYVDMGWSPWVTTLTGIEVSEAYRNPIWDLYTNIWCSTLIQDILLNDTLLPPWVLRKYDCILMTDVIEHFVKETGANILIELMKMLAPGGILLISTPGVFVEQGAVHGNVYERHLSYWTEKDFPIGFTVIKSAKPDHHGDETLIVKYVKQ